MQENNCAARSRTFDTTEQSNPVWRLGLENDVWDIANYFGRDYVIAKNKPLSFSQLLSGEKVLVKARGLNDLTAR